MSSTTARTYRFPFTASQWQELEHQALIFKYMVSGMPIPPDLLFTVRRSMDPSLSSKLMLHQPQHLGWNCFQVGFGRKIDPEPGRCRRTDGKKWRCSKEAYPDSKYCERHMHRGRNRSRKPVEVMSTAASSSSSNSRPLPTAIPISSITRDPSSPHQSLSCLTAVDQSHHYSINHPCYSTPSIGDSISLHHSLIYPHSSSSRPPGIGLSPQENTSTSFLLESNAYSHSGRDRRSSHGHGMKEEVDEHAFFSETSGTIRSVSGSSVEDSWQLATLTMGGSPPLGHLKQQRSCMPSGHSYIHENHNNTSRQQRQDQQYYALGGDDAKSSDLPFKIDRDDHQPKKVMHHFFDEWPPKDNKDTWLDSDDKLSKTQLSISIPNPSSHDFFLAQNGK